MKRITLITIVISCFIFTAITIHASCHDDATCEKVELRLLRSLRWHENYSNRVDYYINDLDPSGMPSLTTDVNAPASHGNWSNSRATLSNSTSGILAPPFYTLHKTNSQTIIM